MIPKSEQSDAHKVFDAVMSNTPDENVVKFAAIKNAQGIDEAFREAIIGDKQVLLDDNDAAGAGKKAVD